MEQTIAVEQLKPGMYVTSLDKSWLSTPFFFRKKMIKSDEEIVRLIQSGVRRVTINTERGTRVSTARYPASSLPQTATELNALSEDLRAVWSETLQAVERIFEEVQGGEPVETATLSHVVKELQTSLLSYPEASLILVQVRHADTSLLSHVVDTCALASLLGQGMQLPQEQLDIIGVGALLHDVGYLKFPRGLWHPSGDPALPDREARDSHPTVGATLLSQFIHLPKAVRRIVLEHHERQNGSGYPAGLSSAALSSPSQIVGIADTYLALVKGEEGNQPHPPKAALTVIEQRGSRGDFDSTFVTQLRHVVQGSEGGPPVVRAVLPHDHSPALFPLVGEAAAQEPRQSPTVEDGSSISAETFSTAGIQIAEVLERLDGDTELFQQIIALFLQEFPTACAEIQEALDRHNAVRLEKSALALKGEAGAVGVTKVAEAARRLEEIGRTGNLDEAGSAINVLRETMHHVQPTLQALSQHGIPSSPQWRPESHAAPRTDLTRSSHKTVLFIGRARSSQIIISGLLRKLGLKFKWLNPLGDAGAALEELRHGSCSLVIMDWNLPDMRGVELLKAIRADPQHHNLPVLVMTGSISREEVLEAKQHRIAGFILRPLTLEKLEDAIVETLGTSER